MNIEEINRKHFMETDMYYRVGYGLSSKLLDYRNGIIFIEVSLGRKWNKSYNATAHELAYCWKDTHKELSKAIACKVFIIDAKKNRYKQTLKARIKNIAKARNMSPAQVALAYTMQRGIAVIPKSINEARLLQNLETLKHVLTKEDMALLKDLDKAHRFIDGKFWEVDNGPYTADSIWNA